MREEPHTFTFCNSEHGLCECGQPKNAEIHNQTQVCTGFNIEIIAHTDDALRYLGHPEKIREMVGKTFDDKGLQEEVDYTLVVTRTYKYGSRS